MQNNVISFRIDHDKLVPGIYLHEVKDYGTNYVTTFDFRFKCPNKGNYLTPTEAHTIEHVMATFFTENIKDKVYWGPMGCLTGFYLVLNGKHDLDDILPLLTKLNDYWLYLLNNNEVPAKTPKRCGNYKLLDINEGYKAWKEFYDSRSSWGNEYPLLEDENFDLDRFKDDIDYNLVLKH